MNTSFIETLQRIMGRMNAKTNSSIAYTDVTLEEQQRIIARIKERNNTIRPTERAFRGHRDLAKMYGNSNV